MTEYTLGDALIRGLRGLAKTEAEKESIDRLERFHGSESDMRVAIDMLRQAGRFESARIVGLALGF